MMMRHPLHPMVVHFPIAFLSFGSLADFAGMIWPEIDQRIAWLFLAIGAVAAIPAMMAGALDLMRLEEKAMQDAQRHITAMGIAWLFYVSALYLRSNGLAPGVSTETASVLLSAMGFIALIIGGWLGGQLVYLHGAGRVER